MCEEGCGDKDIQEPPRGRYESKPRKATVRQTHKLNNVKCLQNLQNAQRAFHLKYTLFKGFSQKEVL